jgi:hypothetical protein
VYVFLGGKYSVEHKTSMAHTGRDACKRNSGLALDLLVMVFTLKLIYMKKYLRMVRVALITLVILLSQISLFAKSNGDTDPGPVSGLSTLQIIGAVSLVLVAILLPLLRGTSKEIVRK